MSLVIPLTNDTKKTLLDFFIHNPSILTMEHYYHRHSPLDSLEHYMWEELNEPEHVNLRDHYVQTKKFTPEMLNIWMQQETKYQ